MEINEEEFAKYLQTFVTDVWGLLVKVTSRPGQDNLTMAAIKFLTTVCRWVRTAGSRSGCCSLACCSGLHAGPHLPALLPAAMTLSAVPYACGMPHPASGAAL